MRLLCFRSTWGVEAPWTAMLGRLPALGFAGVEAPLIHLKDHPAETLAEAGLQAIPMIFTEGSDVDAHVASFRSQLEACRAYDPVCVTCHDGRDAFSVDEADEYFRRVLAIERDVGIDVAHETHRGRILYNPWTTARLLDRFDDLRLCCDFSHWVCVCERLLGDIAPILAAAGERALHVHARVGYEEGPQVPDPSAPEYAEHVAAHDAWWTMIWEAQARRGQAESTLTPEYGPPRYLHTLPHTDAPVADLWEICTRETVRLSERFAAHFG